MELERNEDERRWRAAAVEKDDFGMDREDWINTVNPVIGCRDNEEIPSGALECRQMLNGAESAILPSGITVPVNKYDHQTGNQKKSEGRSSESAPVSVHSGRYHMPAESGRAMFGGRG